MFKMCTVFLLLCEAMKKDLYWKNTMKNTVFFKGFLTPLMSFLRLEEARVLFYSG